MRVLLIFLCLPALNLAKTYCQPNDPCWPTQEEIDTFQESLSPASGDCLRLFPTFTSEDHKGTVVWNQWFDGEGLFVTPWKMLNFRNYYQERTAFFVILARTPQDVSKAVLFATTHNLSIAVMSTGHEFLDRNAGPAANGLLIKTTCLRGFEIDLNPDNIYGHTDGVVRLGSGMTWGQSKYKMTGVHELANNEGRVVVSGHAAEVGVVGWSLGGGHSPFGPLHGLGVDQLVEVELVGADGSFIIANQNGTYMRAPGNGQSDYTENADLFWALQGGGAGPWGVVTALTVKVHKPRDECTENCYIVQTAAWANTFEADDALMAQKGLELFMSWAASASKYWSGYAMLLPQESGSYLFVLAELMFVGSQNDVDSNSLSDTFKDFYPDNFLSADQVVYNTYYDKTLKQSPETIITAEPTTAWGSVLLNATTMNDPSTAKAFVDMWIPKCYRTGSSSEPCLDMIQLHKTFPIDDDDKMDTAVSKVFREAIAQVTTGVVVNTNNDLSYEQKNELFHEDFAPLLYQLGEGSYYSECEFFMNPGQWQQRFWGQENYEKLLEIKKTWDPELVFECRHCIGDEVEPESPSMKTMPPWKRPS